MPLCLVPGGTSGALAFNMGIPDAATGAYAVCKAHVQPLDIFSVVQPPARRFYSFLSLTFGGIPNLDVGTEHLRWAAEARGQRRAGGPHVRSPACWAWRSARPPVHALSCRWMGSLRYTVGAIQESIAQRSYLSSMAFLGPGRAPQPRMPAAGVCVRGRAMYPSCGLQTYPRCKAGRTPPGSHSTQADAQR